jgi:hypothetical protein
MSPTASCYLWVCEDGKIKAIPITGRGGLKDCEMLRIPLCLDNRLIDSRLDCQPYVPASLYSPGRFLVLISVRG